MRILIFAVGFFIFGTANAMHIACNVASAIDGKKNPDKKIVLNSDSNAEDCAKFEAYTIPTTAVVVTVHGHFDCNPSGGFCPDIGPSLDGIEIYNTAGKNYAQSTGSCDKVTEDLSLQLISQTNRRLNVVVYCVLNK